MPELVINGIPYHAAPQANLLEAIRRAGVDLPTLCYLEGLPPYGACRLCLVEVTPSGSPAPAEPAVVAACAYPVRADLRVETHSVRVVAIRKLMLEFLLARCPTSRVLQDLARAAGLDSPRFATDGQADELCILCGLCVRVCQTAIGAAAIGFAGRGSDRRVAAPFSLQAEACIGCGACAAVCPTGAITIEDVDGQRYLRTWNTIVPLKPCPGCGQPYTPEPLSFLRELGAGIDHLWGFCPACRRKHAAALFTGK